MTRAACIVFFLAMIGCSADLGGEEFFVRGLQEDCAGQSGCTCDDDCMKCVASEAGEAQGGYEAITTKCQQNCAQPGPQGFCGADLDNFCTCTRDGPPVPSPTPPPTPPSAPPTPAQPGPEEPWSPPLTGVSFDFAYAPDRLCNECPGSACGQCEVAAQKITNFACNLFPSGGFSFGHGAFEGMACGECVFLRCGGRGCSDTNAPPFAHMRVDNGFQVPANALEVSEEFFNANWSPALGSDSRNYQWAPNPGCDATFPADLESSLVWTTVEPEIQASLRR